MKAIEGFEGYYVTLCGRILSDKFHPKRNINKKIRELKPILNVRGYPCVNLFSDKHFYKTIHRLVAKQYLPNPENKPQVNHKNGIKTDNRVCNLEWCTDMENQNHAFSTGLKSSKGEKHGKCKLNESQVLLIRQDKRKIKEIAADYGVGQTLISNIRNHKRWKHI